MSLNVRLLEKARNLANGIVQARCPACAEGGRDQSGGHLRLYPDGRYGCCVYPKDRDHRRRIFVLAGDKSTRSFTVKVASSKPSARLALSVTASLTGLLGTLGTPISESVASKLNSPEDSGTLGTAILMSRAYARENEVVRCNVAYMCKDIETAVPGVPSSPTGNIGTLGTPISMSRAYARVEGINTCDVTHMCKDKESGVPGVPKRKEAEEPPQPAENQGRLPYIDEYGDMHIPFDSPERYHWWKGDDRMSPDQTLAEIKQRMETEKRKAQNGTGI